MQDDDQLSTVSNPAESLLRSGRREKGGALADAPPRSSSPRGVKYPAAHCSFCCSHGECGRRRGVLPERQSVMVHIHHLLLSLLLGKGSSQSGEAGERSIPLKTHACRRRGCAGAASAAARLNAREEDWLCEEHAGVLVCPHLSPVLAVLRNRLPRVSLCRDGTGRDGSPPFRLSV